MPAGLQGAADPADPGARVEDPGAASDEHVGQPGLTLDVGPALDQLAEVSAVAAVAGVLLRGELPAGPRCLDHQSSSGWANGEAGRGTGTPSSSRSVRSAQKQTRSRTGSAS